MKQWSFWIKNGLKYMLFVMLASIFYGLLMSIDTDFSYTQLISILSSYGSNMTVIMLLIANISRMTFLNNLAISFGETRKNTFIGNQLLNLTLSISSFAIFFILGCISGISTPFFALPAVYILAIGFGMFINSLKLDNNEALNALQAISMIVSIPIVLILCFYLCKPEQMDIVINLANRTFILIITYIVGIIFLIVGTIRTKKKIMLLEVKL